MKGDKAIENSMFYWYPKVKNLDIPQPETLMYRFNQDEFLTLHREEGIPHSIFENAHKLADQIGYPLFMRTDNSSVKHSWNKTCYVPSKDDLKPHIFELLQVSEMQGWMSYTDNGLIFREFLDLEVGHKYGTTLTAFFGEMPINKERRYFIKDGGVQCHHPYWYPDAIERTSYSDWEDTVDYLNKETEDEIKLLSSYALKVAEVFPEYWSVDFAKCMDGKWYLIDMARGENSFHWLDCKYCPDKLKKRYQKKKENRKIDDKEIQEELKKLGIDIEKS